MAEITVTGDRVETVFDLLGRKENDITYALGWGLAQSDDLLSRFLEMVAAPTGDIDAATLDLQRYRKDESRAGITDIEISSPRAHVIVEAKRGWDIPEPELLLLYLPALRVSSRRTSPPDGDRSADPPGSPSASPHARYLYGAQAHPGKNPVGRPVVRHRPVRARVPLVGLPPARDRVRSPRLTHRSTGR